MPSSHIMYSAQAIFALATDKTNSRSSTEADKDMSLLSAASITNAKDHRAWDHDRRRVKRAAEVARMRAQNGRGCTAKVYHSAKASVLALLSEKDKPAWDETEDFDDVPVLQECQNDLSSIARPEVMLADLVTSRKPRKGMDGDFEVIPPIRSVIALDDSLAHEPDTDEPWEHIHSVDYDDTIKELSYAKIASLS